MNKKLFHIEFKNALENKKHFYLVYDNINTYICIYKFNK